MIKVSDVSKSFGVTKVLDNISFEINENAITCITGPSGVGKTTLLNIVSGLIKPDSGNIEIPNGNTLSYLFQENSLMPWSNVYNNIAFVLKDKVLDIEHKIDEFLDLVEMSGLQDKFPDQLSGGMKRRVAIARALAFPYDILIMDEPFKGLDKELENRLLERMIDIWRSQKKTVIIVTHDMEIMKIGNQKIYMKKPM